MSFDKTRLRALWPLIAVAASGAILAGAHVFQALGYAPCELCLVQRWPHWAAIALGLAGLGWSRVLHRPLALRALCVFLGIAFLAGAAVATYHSGVEWKFWPGPATCASTGLGRPIDPADIMRALNGLSRAVPCDVAAWRDPAIGFSMAGWNAILSAGLAVGSFLAAAAPVEKKESE